MAIIVFDANQELTCEKCGHKWKVEKPFADLAKQLNAPVLTECPSCYGFEKDLNKNEEKEK